MKPRQQGPAPASPLAQPKRLAVSLLSFLRLDRSVYSIVSKAFWNRPA